MDDLLFLLTPVQWIMVAVGLCVLGAVLDLFDVED